MRSRAFTHVLFNRYNVNQKATEVREQKQTTPPMDCSPRRGCFVAVVVVILGNLLLIVLCNFSC